MTAAALLQIVIYTIALWLGLYLMARDPADPRLRYAGLGAISYALAVGVGLLLEPPAADARWLARLQSSLLLLPALFWAGALLHLLPPRQPIAERLHRAWRLLLPGALLLFVGATGSGIAFRDGSDGPEPGPLYWLFALEVVLLLAVGLRAALAAQRREPDRRSLGLLLATMIFFGLSVGALLLPLAPTLRRALLLAISVDVILLALVIAALDAFDQGETLRADMGRAALDGTLAAALFGGQVALVMAVSTGALPEMRLLLLSVIAAALGLTMWAGPLQQWLDRVAFGATPLLVARTELREMTRALPRQDGALDLTTLDEERFARLTRRALSQMGNLPRLASSPLIRLPLLERRLGSHEGRLTTLDRAQELQRLLAESIARLKPADGGAFGTTEGWRYYNALYFPYVAGLRPYRRRPRTDGLGPVERQALSWFRSEVPERTLYNWQQAAAQLVARDLREQEG